MSRPLYETKDHLTVEQAVITFVSSCWSCEAHKMPISYKLDYMLTREKEAKAFVEIKSRNMKWGQFPTIFLSLSKVQAAHDLTKTTGLTCFFVVHADPDVYWIDLNDLIGRGDLITFGGRTRNTRDSADVEPVFNIPVDMFRRL